MLISVALNAEDQKIIYGIGMESFVSDRAYNGDGDTFVLDSTIMEFRYPVFIGYNYNKWLNAKLTIPYVYRKAEYFEPGMDKLGKGIGDIELANTCRIMNEESKNPQLDIKLAFIIPSGTNDITGAIGSDKLPTGGPLFGSEGVYRYGGSYGIDPSILATKNIGNHKVSADVGYKITTAVSTETYEFNPGNIFHFALGYGYKASENTSIGAVYSNYSSERTEIDSKSINGTSGITGNISPTFAVEINKQYSLQFKLDIPIYGQNQYKGIGYSFNIVF
jgi:hypothetical protein